MLNKQTLRKEKKERQQNNGQVQYLFKSLKYFSDTDELKNIIFL